MLSKQFVPLIPPHHRYFEVFSGGLSMFFRKEKAEWNVLNDKDNNIVNLYNCIMHDLDKLVYYLDWLPKSRELFNGFRTEIKEKQDINIPDPLRAAKYFYCIRHSFNKLIHTPMSMVKDWNKNWMKEFKYSRSKINGATIENLDFADLIDRYKPKENDFWYLDPPYFIATDKGDYYQHNFNAEDHIRLKEKVDKIHKNGGKFMVSYDFREEVYDLYKEYDCRVIDLKYQGATDENRTKERKEYLIINYEPNDQIGLF
jgi:DNA adenine methylase